MPRKPEQYEAMRMATRERVLTAAVRIFARRGFAATNMREIALEAGISSGAIYRHYATKKELFDELLGQAAAGLAAAVRTLAGKGDPLPLLRDFAARFLADLSTGGAEAEFFMVINQGFTADEPPGTVERLVREHRALWRATTSLIERGQRQGQFAEGDPAELTACYFATLTGLATLRVTLADELPLPGADLVLRPLTEGRADGRRQTR
ncbi:TetR/AcrR family transcriptional regulator [Amycolatopsis azurea]|uniref:TetR/AcrR family transcriptional regulator n=1 Tax=Amycolatopsis azurea TaxID=36819 RepID=UPI0037FD0233